MDLKLPMFCVFERNKLPGVGGMISTMDAVWTILAWSLTALFSGSFPTSDASGRQFKAADAQSLLVGSKLCEALFPFFLCGLVYQRGFGLVRKRFAAEQLQCK